MKLTQSLGIVKVRLTEQSRVLSHVRKDSSSGQFVGTVLSVPPVDDRDRLITSLELRPSSRNDFDSN